jgi:flagellar biosynthesis protein FliQ
MEAQTAIDLGREALVTSLSVGGPILLVGLVIGLVIGLIQALTQVQEQSIVIVPKIVGMFAAIGLLLPWFVTFMVQYTQNLIQHIPDRF